MKKHYLFFLLVFTFFSCNASNKAKVTLENNLLVNRDNQTVEVEWNSIKNKIEGLTKDNVIVVDTEGKQVVSQVLYSKDKSPDILIFQCNIPAKSSVEYTIETGIRENYESKVYGRFVPERKDDFAWENNIMAYRMYGPALEATGEISNGIDVWLKRTDALVVDKWYKIDDYHKDNGEGLDCYKVGRTLGAGAMAPYKDSVLYLSNNYTKYKIVDNGPIRLTFELDYAPYQTYEGIVEEKRIISLDANDRFNKITECYSKQIDVAAGIVLRPTNGTTIEDASNGIIAYWEPVNGDNGHTAVTVIFDSAIDSIVNNGNHLLGVTKTNDKGEISYYMGASWDKAGVTKKEWTETASNKALFIANPLKMTID